jgi:glutamate 5-kinase
MRSELLKNIKRVVIKIGSRVLTGEEGDLNRVWMSALAFEVSALRGSGIEVIIVSSGAVAAGRALLGIFDRPRTIPQKQAAAAVGQPRLMREYEGAFLTSGSRVAQILLTREDLADRQRFLNARTTLDTLLEFGIVPIINENDTVAVEEIKFGDNDNLSALVTNLVDATLLVIMTDIDGFYDADPRQNPSARLIPVVRAVTREMERAAGGSGSTVGTGGMATKLAAAKKAGRSGAATLIVNGTDPKIISRIFNGEDCGTLVLPAARSLTSRKHWIAFTLRPQGKVFVDEGAVKVLRQEGRSLLASGVTRIEGNFERGSCIRVCDQDGNEFARGIADYSSAEAQRIMGRKSLEIEEILGYRYGDELIHRDNFVLL